MNINLNNVNIQKVHLYYNINLKQLNIRLPIEQ